MRTRPPCSSTLGWLLAALACPAAPAGPPAATSAPSEPPALARARTLLADGQAAAAVDLLTPCLDELPAEGVALYAAACRAAGRSAENGLRRAVARHPDDPTVQLAWIDAALESGRYAQALQRIAAAGALADRPEFEWRAARAHFALGELVGAAEIRAVPGGRAGQFVGRLLLVEERPGTDRFLCCPPASALYQLRRALDDGLDEPAAHVLHARIWQRLGRPEVAWAVLRTRAAAILGQGDDDALETYAEAALRAGFVDEYLRAMRRRAARSPARRAALLAESCRTVAEHYARAGDETLHLQWLYRALEHAPGDPALWLTVGDAEWARGALPAAQRAYRRVLALAADTPRRAELLERLAAEPAADREPGAD